MHSFAKIQVFFSRHVFQNRKIKFPQKFSIMSLEFEWSQKKYRIYLAFDFAYEHTNIGPVMLTDNAWVARPWSWIREARYNPSSL